MGCTDVGVLVGVLDAGGVVAGALGGGVVVVTVSGDAGAAVVPV